MHGRVATGFLVLALLLAACAPARPSFVGERAVPESVPPATAPRAVTAPGLNLPLGAIPFPFEENRGQAPADLRYFLRAGPMRVGFADGGPRFRLSDGAGCEALDGGAPGACAEAGPGHLLSLELVGAAGALPTGSVPAETVVSYLKGAPEAWLIGVPAFHQVAYPEAWPGIDVQYERAPGGLKATYHLAPAADPSRIRLAWHGAEAASLTEDGMLALRVPGGVLRESAPVAWQDDSRGERTAVDARFELLADGTDGGPVEVGLTLGASDPTLPLTIDPVLVYSTYLGGNGDDVANAIAVDGTGAAYVVGIINSTNFPTANPVQASPGGDFDAFVAKLTPAGTALAYSTYLGGSSVDTALGVAVDGSGNAYVAGSTSSSNFPTANPVQASSGGLADAFVARLNAAGTALAYSTYLGGSAFDSAHAIAVDGTGAAHVVGQTSSSNFPTASPIQASLGGVTDAFVAKLTPAGTALAYSTYLGGSGIDVANGVALEGSGAAYVVGHTVSTNFPTANPIQASPGGDFDAFVARLNAAGTALVYSTHLGGSGVDTALGVAVDGSGAAYVAGQTSSSDFPTANPIQAARAGGNDAFVAKLDAAGSALAYSTYLGGSTNDDARGVAVDGSGNAYVAGITNSANFPTVNPIQASPGGDFDAFAAKLDAAGSALAYSTYLGGSGIDSARGVAVDGRGAAYVAGQAISTDFPTANPIQAARAGGSDAFVAKIGEAAVTPTLATQVSSAAIAPGGSVQDTATVTPPTGGPIPTGTVSFTMFGPDDAACTGTPAFASANRPLAQVAGGAAATSEAFTPTVPGTYRFVAAYSGDASYSPAVAPCNAPNETVVVGRGTATLTTQVSAAAITPGASVQDTATLAPPAGGPVPTGTVTFTAFGPDDATCSGAPVFTSANRPLSPGAGSAAATSEAFTPTALGTYRFVVAYSGDPNYNPATAPCNAPNETVVVTLSPVFSIADVRVAEGNAGTTDAIFTVTLTNTGAGTATVQYTTVNGTATTADNDYQARSGTLTFPPGGPTSQTISVHVVGDTRVEPDETFFVDLTGPTNALIAGFRGIGTIANDDATAPPAPPAPPPPPAEPRRDDDEDDKPRLTEEQRHQQRHTNAGNRGDVSIEGGVVAVERAPDGRSLLVTIALIGDETQIVQVPCEGAAAAIVCPDIRVGDYLEADGYQNGVGDLNSYFVASDGVKITRNGKRVR